MVLLAERPEQSAQRCLTRQTVELQPAQTRDERAFEICERLIDIVAAVYGVSGREIREPGRSNISVCRVRQIGMYVAHVTFRLKMRQVGDGFGRDRTTVMHACHIVEDLRDDADFDCSVAMVERVALAVLLDGGRV